MNITRHDESIARSIQDQINCIGITENAVFPEKREKYCPRTLVDETLEYIDPTPNIHTLFVQFNKKFFWNMLLPVQVKWSTRMTSCAGICSFHPRNKECIISLSIPLLKLRPRKDLIETLLHEMIHAYLFLTNDTRDRDGHGLVFQSHMNRINKEAGTNITIYHSFYEEVRLYKQHWWRCNGPCHKRTPFFGTVKRAMNRAPGPNDFWWNEHQLNCGGQFIKIKEPQKPEKKKKIVALKSSENKNIADWIKKTNKHADNNIVKSNLYNLPKPIHLKNIKTNTVLTYHPDIKKLGNYTNNVHGWDTGSPSSTNHNYKFTNKIIPSNSLINTKSSISFSGVLGGINGRKSILLDRFSNPEKTLLKNKSSIQSNSNKIDLIDKSSTNIKQHSKKVNAMKVLCPNCNKSVDDTTINYHLDICLENSETITDELNKKMIFEDDCTLNEIKDKCKSNLIKIQCPICLMKIEVNHFNDHLSNCFQTDLIGTINKKSIPNSSCNSITSTKSTIEKLSNIIDMEPCFSGILQCSEKNAVYEKFSNTSSRDFLLKNSIHNQLDINKINLNNKSMKNSNAKCIIKMQVTCPSCKKSICESNINNHLDICLENSENTNISKKFSKKRKSEDSYTSNKIFKNKNMSTSIQNYSSLYSSQVKVNKSEKHLDGYLANNIQKKLEAEKLTQATSSLINLYDSPQFCLICNKLLGPTMSLQDHLEECVASVFNNSNDATQSTNDMQQIFNVFPCPVCTTLIEENLMSDHLNTCFEKIE